MKKAAFLIIIIGLGLSIFTAFTYFTKEKVIDLGNVEISRQEPHYLSWSPIIGIIVTAVGGILLWQSTKKN